MKNGPSAAVAPSGADSVPSGMGCLGGQGRDLGKFGKKLYQEVPRPRLFCNARRAMALRPILQVPRPVRLSTETRNEDLITKESLSICLAPTGADLVTVRYFHAPSGVIRAPSGAPTLKSYLWEVSYQLWKVISRAKSDRFDPNFR